MTKKCKYNNKIKIFVLKSGNKALENNKIGRIKERMQQTVRKPFPTFSMFERD